METILHPKQYPGYTTPSPNRLSKIVGKHLHNLTKFSITLFVKKHEI